ncbi:mucin-3B [Drosophila virilis]|uniref:BZIP domain-containing protein n=1 Tax=Drosophila virilis TaxID=7244 RepID=B4MC17_DROVI|nr:uncharacterized protein LOC6635110 [Drosophila virilis]EDW58638.1 uncharacterized protein Dvir_GJ14549 [Drosophila virilis]
MIQEPARVQATTYEARGQQKSNVIAAGERIYSANCNCSPKRIERIAHTRDSPMLTSTTTTTTTTIPIVINTQPNPRIILIKVPTHSRSSRSSRTEESAPRTRLIRIPFLPGSVPTTASVKHTLPTASSSVNYTTSATASRIASQANPLTGIIYPPERCSNSSGFPTILNQVANDQILDSPLTTTATVTQTVQVSSTPQTLASMAGIQLTGADMLSSRQDMSGAMPTATVEEIDVPVFIDEYLENIEATSSTSSSSNKSGEIGKEICTETDIFDFDFDINLIAEDHIERKEMDQCNLDMDSNYSDNINSDINGMDELQFQLLEEGEEEALDMGSMCNGIDITSNLGEEPDLGNILTSAENPMLSNFSQGSMLYSSSQTKCIYELPMLADENSMENYYNASQQSLGFGLGLGISHQLDGVNEDACSAVLVQDAPPASMCLGVKRTASAAGLVNAAESMPMKRSNLLHLNINKSQLISQPDIINTPDIIEQVLNFDDANSVRNNVTNQDLIYEELRSTEDNTAFTILPDFSAPNTPNSNYSVSSTTRSHQATCQTGFAGFITAPVSPAFSTASTSQFSVTTSITGNSSSKRKRGRPAKEHAEGPDPELMAQMTEDDAKAYRDRIKNNEASRVSRRKTKQREHEEMKEEQDLQAEHEQLTYTLQLVMREARRYQEYLKRNYHKNSTYVKPEPDH